MLDTPHRAPHGKTHTAQPSSTPFLHPAIHRFFSSEVAVFHDLRARLWKWRMDICSWESRSDDYVSRSTSSASTPCITIMVVDTACWGSISEPRRPGENPFSPFCADVDSAFHVRAKWRKSHNRGDENGLFHMKIGAQLGLFARRVLTISLTISLTFSIVLVQTHHMALLEADTTYTSSK